MEKIMGGKKLGFVRYLITNASFQITFWMRIGGWLSCRKDVFSRILLVLVSIIHKHNQYKTGIQIAMGHPVKGGLMFPHFSGIVINGGAKIGRNCTILHGVTIGSVRGPKGGVPTIGDNVVIATGSAVIGNVSVGNNVMIGAHSLVLQDIPDSAVVVGNPARIVSMDGAEKTKYYL
ncbi:serine acetyltransferase [Bacteroides acidifaciens]|uniref:serine O-acetyltransferase n=1 Tax=Bacteroides acidifaciens TaxID=85831 RepID=UPI0025ADAD68|nr:serine acetyltransferase [Bacteroides acidifaciens]